MSYDSNQINEILMIEANKLARIMLRHEMDCYTQEFINRRSSSVVVHIGCGNATMLLKTGDHVRVYGYTGTVDVLNRIG